MGKFKMQRFDGVVSCNNSVVKIFVSPKSINHFVLFYLNAVFAVLQVNVFKLCGAVFLRRTIAQVFRIRGRSKIFNFVICFASVNVVNNARQKTVMPQENCAMLSYTLALNANPKVTLHRWLLLDSLPYAVAPITRFFVNKISVWVVVKPRLEQFLRDKICFVHAVVPFKRWFGKWRLGVDSIGPLRYCTKGAA